MPRLKKLKRMLYALLTTVGTLLATIGLQILAMIVLPITFALLLWQFFKLLVLPVLA